MTLKRVAFDGKDGQQAEVMQNLEIENVRYIVQGEVRHRNYKRLKLGGGHVYDRSSV
jgi:TolB-like protein